MASTVPGLGVSKYFLRSKGTDASVKRLMATFPRRIGAHHVVDLIPLSSWDMELASSEC